MFKKVSFAMLTAAAALVLGLTGTANADEMVVDLTGTANADEMVVDLEAGNSGGFMVGTVSVDNDASTLTVVYEIPTEKSGPKKPNPKGRGNGGGGGERIVVWEFLETHLYVGSDNECAYVPHNQNFNVKTGWFPYTTSYEPGSEVTEVSYTIPLPVDTDDELCIAAHALVAIVELVDGVLTVTDSESAWGYSDEYGAEFADDRNWSRYFTYIVHDHE